MAWGEHLGSTEGHILLMTFSHTKVAVTYNEQMKKESLEVNKFLRTQSIKGQS